MAVFPTLSEEPTTDYQEDYYKPSVRTEFDGNYSQVRPKFTRAVNIFSINFKLLTQTDKSTLKTFFAANQGTSFTWTNPADSVEYLVRFKQETLQFKFHSPLRYDVNIILEEV